MGIKFENTATGDAADRGQSPAIVESSTNVIEPARPNGQLVPKLIADAGEQASLRFLDLRIPTKPATHSNRKPATCSDPKPAGVPI